VPIPDLDQSQQDKLIQLGTAHTFPKNTLLIAEGDQSAQIYIVVYGRVKVFLSDADGKEIIVDTLGPNDYFGEMALDGAPRSASVMTMEVTKVSMVQREDFRQYLRDHPDASYALILRLIGRSRHWTRTIGNLALMDVYGRVAKLLLDHAREDAGRLVVDRLTHQEIAEGVNCSREMASRILSDLRTGSYIALDGDRILIQRTLPERG
jgi:CRP/FNR family cyclic AMP-dependent transcriptional regulator